MIVIIPLSLSQDDDHGYVAGTAIQGIQKPLESSGNNQISIYLSTKRMQISSANQFHAFEKFTMKNNSCISF